ncbi:MAG: HAD-IA family hydrolase [Acidimicrobiales bacterium]
MPPRDRDQLGDPKTGVRAVLFDFGGVLCASPFDAFGRYEQAHGLPAGFIRSLNARDHHGNAWARLERNEITVAQFITLFEGEAEAAGHHVDGAAVLTLLGGEIRPRMLRAVARCRSRYLTGLLTNNFLSGEAAERPGGAIDQVLRLFDEVVESSRVGVRKPEPRFFEIACDRLGIAPKEAVFLDDIGVNLKPAREMGMATIKVVTEGQALADLERLVGLELS